jgi:hypothetical protein
MRKKRRFYLGFQFSLFEDAQGCKLGLKLLLFRFHYERILYLKRNPDWGKQDTGVTPKQASPDIFAQPIEMKPVGPEDMR